MLFKKIITVPYQAFFFVFVTTLLIIFNIKPLFTFRPIFEEPSVHERSEQDIKNLGLKKVIVGLSIDDFVTFNFKKNIFVMKGVLWFDFDPKQVLLKDIDDFYIERGRIVQKHGPLITQLDNGLSRAMYYVTCEYTAILDFSMFPFDDHRVFLGIAYPSLNPREYVVSSSLDSYVLNDNMHLSGWLVKMHRTKSGVKTVKMPEEKHVELSKSYFSIGVTKRDFRLIMLILLPLLLIFYLGMFSLSLVGDKSISLALTSVSGLVAYRYVINALEPEVSYLLITDYFFILLLSAAFVIFVVNLFCASDYTKLSTDVLDTIKAVVLMVIYAMLLGGWYYLTNVMFFANTVPAISVV